MKISPNIMNLERGDVVPNPGELWRHVRSGGLYRVLDFCLICGEVDQVAVAYHRDGSEPSVEFVRPLGGPGGWTTPNGDHTLRFAKVVEMSK